MPDRIAKTVPTAFSAVDLSTSQAGEEFVASPALVKLVKERLPADAATAPMADELIELYLNRLILACMKNRRYKNSALAPRRIFARATAETLILARIDDKISRIEAADELRKNDVADLAGYLDLLMIRKGWNQFADLID